MHKPYVKVCCISSLSEAQAALKAGAFCLGFVSEMPSGPGVISLAYIQDIVAALPPDTRSVLLTSKQNAQDIILQHDRVKTWGIQLVDKLPMSELKALRKLRPNTMLFQVIHVSDKSSIQDAVSCFKSVDFLLLDSGNPKGEIKTLGGTGNTHDWEISREICKLSPRPVFLAGGLNAENVSRAVSQVQPHGVDLCSGIRSNGNLDIKKLNDFMFELDHTF